MWGGFGGRSCSSWSSLGGTIFVFQDWKYLGSIGNHGVTIGFALVTDTALLLAPIEIPTLELWSALDKC